MDLRIAVLDMNDGHANQGMRCIREIIKHWSTLHQYNIQLDEFNVRQKTELPDLSYDIYISSGGPGSPLESVDEAWDKQFCQWIQAVEDYNTDVNHYPKKHVFFICHSYQLACRYYGLAKVSERKSMSFGVFPMHMTEAASNEPVFDGLQDPFYAVDSRSYQVTEPDDEVIEKMGAQILAIEKDRPHVPYDRAVMAIRFNDYFIGTQFHPEADAIGMSMHLQTEDKKKSVIENHGEAKWKSMIEQLNDPDKIMFTYSHILPNFLNIAAGAMIEAA
ncbi:type 1 glutamine amidotransferase [Ilyomonas limi]|uniref:type 1 glutamine amidotransferase n=1 Tax=Ilyomonas limi TaxID=2575867 RepID=UPI00148515E0|nr:GMP synthase [Ilyomonas limi]